MIRNGHIVSYGENIFRQVRSKQTLLSEKTILKSVVKTPIDGFNSLLTFLQLPQQETPWQIRKNKGSMKEAVRNNTPAYIIYDPTQSKKDVPLRFSYLQTDNGSRLELVYSYQLQLEKNWYHAHVSTRSGKVEALTDWVSNAVYKVLDINAVDISQDKRKIIHAHPNRKASPYGWHSNGRSSYRDTRGNNVWAQQNPYKVDDLERLYRPSGGSRLAFRFLFNQKEQPEENRNAAITQLFYINNVLHDVLYQYGFDEVSGNFQDNNGDKGGVGGDFVIANGLDETSYNNAQFATAPDGQRGKMSMYIFYATSPPRDGIFDVGIVIHEYGHGLSNRLTGGPANTDCLPDGESGGMGEGWSDVLAVVLSQKPSNKRTDKFPMAVYASPGQPIRFFPYSTNFSVSPVTFSYIDSSEQFKEVHGTGEVWAAILLEVYWNLVDTLGFTSDVYSASIRKGNTFFLQLMINGMKLQPCRPTFIQARDAFLQAEVALTHRKYACDLWRGFAKRGLGYDATRVDNVAMDGFELPNEC